MPTLILRGTYIRFVDTRYDPKSKTVYSKLNLTSSFSEPVRKEMGWGEPPEGFGSAKLDGEYHATEFTLSPNGMKDENLKLDAKSISDFHFMRREPEEGKKAVNELTYQVVTADPNAGALLHDYLTKFGRAEGQLKIKYLAQSDLEMEAEEGAEAQESLINAEQSEATAETSDDPKPRRKSRLEPVN